MPTNSNVHFRSRDGNEHKFPKAIGIGTFQKILERDFFSECIIDVEYCNQSSCFDLIINLHCNFTLIESLSHLNTGNWGCFKTSDCHGTRVITSPFQNHFQQIKEVNTFTLGIRELSIHLKDIDIVIGRLYENSIPDQIGLLLDSLSQNFVYFTKGMTEMPYEIFIPVFEDISSQTLSDTKIDRTISLDYFSFWGLYFESMENMQIYDYRKRNVIDGNLYLTT